MTAPNNYGTEIKWTWDRGLIPGHTVSGVDVVAQAQMIRLDTRRGSCPGAPNDGISLKEMLHSEATPAALGRLPGVIRTELLKDDRVRSVDVALVPNSRGGYDLRINGVCKYGETYSLVLPVADLTVGKVLGA
jgi:phage baseplate assembly protein W